MDKETFFNQNKLQETDFILPSSDKLKLTELTAGQRSKLQKIIMDDPVRAQANIVAMSAPIFTDADVTRILEMPGMLIERIADAVLAISGMGGDAVGDAKKK